MEGVVGLQKTGYEVRWKREITTHWIEPPFVAGIIDRGRRYERTAPPTKVHTRYSEIVSIVIGGKRQPAWTEEAVDMLRKTVEHFNCIVVITFDRSCGSDLYTLQYHFYDHIVEYLRKF